MTSKHVQHVGRRASKMCETYVRQSSRHAVTMTSRQVSGAITPSAGSTRHGGPPRIYISYHTRLFSQSIISAPMTPKLKRKNKQQRACCYGYLPADFLSLEDLLDSSDESLFTATRYNPQHVLHQLLPPPNTLVISAPVYTASPSLLYPLSSCTKTS